MWTSEDLGQPRTGLAFLLGGLLLLILGGWKAIELLIEWSASLLG